MDKNDLLISLPSYNYKMEENECNINKSDKTNTSQSNVDAKTQNSDLDGVVRPRRKIVVEPLLVMYYLSSTAILQIYQLYVYERIEENVAERTGVNKSEMEVYHTRNLTINPCEEDIKKYSMQYNFTQAAQAENAHYLMVSQVTNTLPALIAMIILGPYSDKGGRKIIIVPYIVAELVSSIVLFFVFYFKMSVWILQVNTVLCGLTGGWALMHVGCYSYIADTTTKEERLFRFTLLDILEQLASIVGPIGIGYWIKHQGYLWPIVAIMACKCINTAYAIFFIPETVKKDENAKFLSLSHMKRSAEVFVKNDETNRRWKLWILLLVFITYCIGYGVMTPLSLFELNTPLCWDSVTIGYYKTASSVVAAFGGLCITRGLKAILSDETIGIISSLAHTIQFIFMAFIKNTLMMFLCEYN